MPRMMVPGVPSVFSDFTNSWAMSTGFYTGDGRQASHWKDNALTGVLIGAMDPTLPANFISPLSADIRALDLIGWDAQEVPEPATLLLLGAGVVACLRRRRPQAN